MFCRFQGIVATAIPAITDDFHVLSHVGWYSGACFMLVGTTSAMWGKLYTYMPAKWVYMLSLLIYLVGSIVAAAPPTSSALIAGRAVQGLGCAGTHLPPAFSYLQPSSFTVAKFSSINI